MEIENPTNSEEKPLEKPKSGSQAQQLPISQSYQVINDSDEESFVKKPKKLKKLSQKYSLDFNISALLPKRPPQNQEKYLSKEVFLSDLRKRESGSFALSSDQLSPFHREKSKRLKNTKPVCDEFGFVDTLKANLEIKKKRLKKITEAPVPLRIGNSHVAPRKKENQTEMKEKNGKEIDQFEGAADILSDDELLEETLSRNESASPQKDKGNGIQSPKKNGNKKKPKLVSWEKISNVYFKPPVLPSGLVLNQEMGEMGVSEEEWCSKRDSAVPLGLNTGQNILSGLLFCQNPLSYSVGCYLIVFGPRKKKEENESEREIESPEKSMSLNAAPHYRVQDIQSFEASAFEEGLSTYRLYTFLSEQSSQWEVSEKLKEIEDSKEKNHQFSKETKENNQVQSLGETQEDSDFKKGDMQNEKYSNSMSIEGSKEKNLKEKAEMLDIESFQKISMQKLRFLFDFREELRSPESFQIDWAMEKSSEMLQRLLSENSSSIEKLKSFEEQNAADFNEGKNWQCDLAKWIKEGQNAQKNQKLLTMKKFIFQGLNDRSASHSSKLIDHGIKKSFLWDSNGKSSSQRITRSAFIGKERNHGEIRTRRNEKGHFVSMDQSKEKNENQNNTMSPKKDMGVPSQQIGTNEEFIYESDCGVCFYDLSSDMNPIIYCSNEKCTASFHQSCYLLSSSLEEDCFCDKCQRKKSKSLTTKSTLCFRADIKAQLKVFIMGFLWFMISQCEVFRN